MAGAALKLLLEWLEFYTLASTISLFTPFEDGIFGRCHFWRCVDCIVHICYWLQLGYISYRAIFLLSVLQFVCS